MELRALTTAVRWVLSSPQSVGSRLLGYVDSLVVLFAVRKGRSSAHVLLKRLRHLSAFLLCSGVSLYCNWIPTEVNPADAPSRRYKFDSTLGFPGEGPGRRFLQTASKKPATREKYKRAVQLFLDWLHASGESPETLPELDEVLSEYFHDVYYVNGGRGRSHANCVLHGIQMLCPTMKGHFHTSALALKGWERLVPSVPHPPLTYDLTVVVAARMAMAGSWSGGVGALLAFDCYLRVGELCNIRRCDVAMVDDPRLGAGVQGVHIRLADTKTGSNQSVEVRSPVVRELLRQLLNRVPEGRDQFLFPSTSQFRRCFKQACSYLGLSLAYVPHSLRHGGATHDHLRGLTVEDILRLGRWASTKSARHYIQSGRALLLTMEIPPHVAEIAALLCLDVLTTMTHAE